MEGNRLFTILPRSWNPGMVWVGMDLIVHLLPTPPPSPGCSGHHPNSPKLPGISLELTGNSGTKNRNAGAGYNSWLLLTKTHWQLCRSMPGSQNDQHSAGRDSIFSSKQEHFISPRTCSGWRVYHLFMR